MSIQEINLELLKRLQKPKRRKKGERRKRTPRQKLVKEILKVWSQIVRKRAAGGLCEYCTMRPVQNGHHIIPRGRSYHYGHHALENGCGLCAYCHKWEGPHSDDLDKVAAFSKWVKTVYLPKKGIEYEALKMKCRSRTKYTVFDLDFILKDLKKDLQSM